MNIPDLVTILRFKYHANMLDVNNVLNQLGLRSDDKANEIGRRHCMTIFNDIFPRLFGWDAVKKLFEERTGEDK